MADVFDEVEQAQRQEMYKALLRRYGPWLLGVAILVIAFVASYQAWNGHKKNIIHTASDQFVAAQNLIGSGETIQAELALEKLAESDSNGYQILALMNHGDLALKRGEISFAARLYERAGEVSSDPIIGDLARYKSILIQFDTISFDDLSIRVQTLIKNEGYYGVLARELIGLAAIREKRWDEARRTYDMLAIALDMPPGLRQRIQEAQSYILQNAPETVVSAVTASEPVNTDAITQNQVLQTSRDDHESGDAGSDKRDQLETYGSTEENKTENGGNE